MNTPQNPQGVHREAKFKDGKWMVGMTFPNHPTNRYDTPVDYSPPTERRLEIRLLKWPMWKKVPWWNIRIAFKSRFLMFGPYELRFEYHENNPN